MARGSAPARTSDTLCMRRGCAFALITVLLGCSTDPVRTGSSTELIAGSVPSGPETAMDDSAICTDETPVVTALVGSVNTIVVPANVADFGGDVEALPAEACPGDSVAFVVSIVNESTEPAEFSAGRGLIFSSGMMANWELAPLDELAVTVQPGERLDQTVVGTIPAVGPGTYRVGPEGAGFFGQIVIRDPTAE